MQRKNDFMRQDILEMRKQLDSGKKCFQHKAMTLREFENQLKKILRTELENRKWDDFLFSIYNGDNSVIEGKYFKQLMSEINKIIRHVKSYRCDLWADINMGLLRSDVAYDVYIDDAMKTGWDSKACNSKVINVENARKYYPLVDYGDEDFPMSGIPGGCEDYHRLMMQQNNIGFFDISSDKDSLKQYAFPKTHEIFKELSDSPIENLFLLEKTQGIGYTNQLFHYLKDITEKEKLKELKEIIKLGTEMPMFIRKEVTDKIWSYLKSFQYNNASVEYVKNEMNGVVAMVKNIYKEFWKFGWKTVQDGKLPEYGLEGNMINWWSYYFSEAEVFNDFIRNKAIYGCINVNEVDDCCFRIGEKGEELFQKDERGEEFIRRIKEYTANRDRKQGKRNFEKKEEIYENVLREMKAEEQKIWDKVDPRAKTIHLKPMDVYAMIHADIVRVLNE